MGIRILLAGIIGGLLTFAMGAVNHMVFEFGDRSIHRLPDEEAFQAAIRSQNLQHGMYGFPRPAERPRDDAAMNAFNEKYKQGPNGMLIVGATGEDLMPPHHLIAEAVTNIVFCLLAAWVVSRFDPRCGFIARWLAVVAIGLMAWLSIPASYAIWYRFHSSFIHDELFGSLIETAVAGLAIAAIVRPKLSAAPANQPV
ncbi:MAG: hypothetical protein HY290_33710 [Planctomycetia bacterium]|nr:hypothetical protein [Planctomycetia bacterium]